MTVIHDPVTAIEPEQQGAKRRRAGTLKPVIQHTDKINQPITINSVVAFAFSYSNGVRLGTVVKLTAKRVRVAYKHNWRDKNGALHTYEWNYLANPERVLVLTDSLQQELTILKLKGQLP